MIRLPIELAMLCVVVSIFFYLIGLLDFVLFFITVNLSIDFLILCGFQMFLNETKKKELS